MFLQKKKLDLNNSHWVEQQMLNNIQIINTLSHPDLLPNQLPIFNKFQLKMKEKYKDYDF